MSAINELNQGTIIKDRYVLKEYKGSGSFGEVWLAHDNMVDIDVAVKVYISLDAKGLEEFKTEYKTAYGLAHPNLLAASYYDVWNNRPFLVMKYCPNGSASLVGDVTEEQLWHFIHDVAAGLAYLHEQEPEPIVHQDIKPDNILIDEHGTFLITDFGISKKIRSTMRRQSKRDIGAGATAYMGPERFSKDPMPINASDIWSLGASIYEMATGELPFCGMGGTMQRNGAEIPELGPQWSPALNFVMQSCLAKETWDRPRARQLADFARQVLDGYTPAFSWKDGMEDSGNHEGTGGDDAHGGGGSGGGTGKPEIGGTVDERRGGKRKSVKDSDPNRKKKVRKLVSSLVSVAAVAAVAVVLLHKSPLEKEADSQWEHYAQLVQQCRDLTDKGGSSNVEDLKNAQACMADIEDLESKYASVNEDYSQSASLRPALDEKVTAAQQAWAQAAESQYTDAKDAVRALEYYQLALSLKDDEQLKAKVHDLAPENGYMVVSAMDFANSDTEGKVIDEFGAQLKASTLKYLTPRITYTGLTDEDRTVSLDIKIMNEDGKLVTGSSSRGGYSYDDDVTVSPGAFNTETISGWGNNDGGTYSSGTYYCEVWYKGNRLFRQSVVLD